ncbi:MAG: hypothetical protein EXR79_03340 [Myxococcales bacterium]|nr:hypothetical protein [Myxococcales bacterium]
MGEVDRTVVLHLCTSCRAGPGPHASVRALQAAARRQAAAAGIDLRLVRSSCLGSCEPGLSAVVETALGVVRLALVATGADAALAVQQAGLLVAGTATALGGAVVVSRLNWADLDE